LAGLYFDSECTEERVNHAVGERRTVRLRNGFLPRELSLSVYPLPNDTAGCHRHSCRFWRCLCSHTSGTGRLWSLQSSVEERIERKTAWRGTARIATYIRTLSLVSFNACPPHGRP